MVFFLLNFTRDNVLALFGIAKYSHLFIFELVDMIIMALAIGYIFSSFIRKPQPIDYDPLKHYKNKSQRWENIKFSAMVAGSTVVIHELAHKFVAMFFGAQTVLYAPYGWYLIAVLLQYMHFPIIFFVGGFVAHSPMAPLPSAIVALAGPLINILLWYGTKIAIKKNLIKRKYYHAAVIFARLNLLFGLFNLIPLPGFDGYHFLSSLFQVFRGI